MTLKCVLLTLLVSLLSLLQSIGQDSRSWQLSQQYTPPDVRSGNLFGNAVDIDGNYAIASAHRHSPIINGDTIKQAGAVYLFEKDGNNNWNEVQKLTAPDAIAYDYFGIDAGISGTTAVIGAHYNSSDADNENIMPAAGAVYIFERNENGLWEFWQKLLPSDRDTLDWFGQSLSIHQNRLIVGAPGEDEDAEGNSHLQAAGSAYIFEKANDGYWYEQQKIVPEFREAEAQFGLEVKIYNDNAVVRHFRYRDLVQAILFEYGLSTFSFYDNRWMYTELFKANGTNFNSFDINDNFLAILYGGAKSFFIEGVLERQYLGAILVNEKDSENNWINVDSVWASAPSTGFGTSLSINNNNEIFTRERGINILENGDTVQGDWLQHFTLDSIDLNWNTDDKFFIERLAVQEIAYSENEAIFALGFGFSDRNVIFTNKDISTSILNFNNDNAILNIYPNPFKQQFFIELPASSNAENVIIYNNLMQSVPFSSTKKDDKLNIEINESGQLFYIQHQKQNGFIITQPIIKY